MWQTSTNNANMLHEFKIMANGRFGGKEVVNYDSCVPNRMHDPLFKHLPYSSGGPQIWKDGYLQSGSNDCQWDRTFGTGIFSLVGPEKRDVSPFSRVSVKLNTVTVKDAHQVLLRTTRGISLNPLFACMSILVSTQGYHCNATKCFVR